MQPQDKSRATNSASTNKDSEANQAAQDHHPEANDEANDQDDPQTETKTGDDIPLLEWLVAILGLILVAGSISFLVYQAVTGDSLPPDITFQQDSVTPVNNGYLLRFRATNEGDVTAKGLLVEGQLTDAGQEIETSETTLDYIPSHSDREGGLFFSQDPRQFQLEIRAVGYEQP